MNKYLTWLGVVILWCIVGCRSGSFDDAITTGEYECESAIHYLTQHYELNKSYPADIPSALLHADKFLSNRQFKFITVKYTVSPHADFYIIRFGYRVGHDIIAHTYLSYLDEWRTRKYPSRMENLEKEYREATLKLPPQKF